MAFGGDSPESYYDEGLTASMKGDIVQAIHYFERAVHMDRSFVAARHQLGKAYARIGRADDAVSLLRDVVARKPANLAARVDLGYALLTLGNVPEAREHFNFIVGSESESPRGYLGLAETFFDEGNWNAAVMQAREAIRRGGNSFQALFLLGRAARLQGDISLSKESLDAADSLLEQSVETAPDQPEGHYFRGEVSFAREQYGTALDHYRAAEHRADSRKVYAAFGESFNLLDILAKQGLCYQRLGQADRAREIGRRILQANPQHRLAQSLAQE